MYEEAWWFYYSRAGRHRRGDYYSPPRGVYGSTSVGMAVQRGERPTVTDELLAKYPIVTDQVDRVELRVILSELEKCLQAGMTSAVVEFGCYAGTTSLFIRRLLNAYESKVAFHVYDSFEGLPPKTRLDESRAGEQFVTGALAVSKKEFLLNFRKGNLAPPFVHKGWFNDLTDEDVPREIGFAFMDGDYYESVRDSLRVVSPCLASGAVIVVDDYANESLPGAAKATDEWLREHDGSYRVQASLCVIKPFHQN